MNNSKYNAQITSAISKLRTTDPTVEIQSFASAGPGLARVVLDVTHTSESRADHTLVGAAVRKKLQGKMECVSGSFKNLTDGRFVQRITGLVGAVRESIAVSTSSDLKGFRSMSSNMFMDDEKDMWVLRKTPGGKLLVKATGIDDDLSLLSLLDSVSSAGYASSPERRSLVAQCSATPAQGGDYVSFVDVNNNIRSAFVLASVKGTQDLLVLDAISSDEPDMINAGTVIEVHPQGAEFPAPEETAEDHVDQVVAAARGSSTVETLVAYYKKIFASNPKFFKEFESRVRAHAFM